MRMLAADGFLSRLGAWSMLIFVVLSVGWTHETVGGEHVEKKRDLSSLPVDQLRSDARKTVGDYIF